jgi:hypothetical protein
MALPTYGVLGQVQPAATTLATVYTVPNGRHTIARVIACNTVASAGAFRVAIEVNGEADNPANYVAYDEPINANDSLSSVPMGLNQNDVVKVRSVSGSVSFSVTGIEQDL